MEATLHLASRTHAAPGGLDRTNGSDQNVIKGSAPTMHVTYSAATNRQTGESADANGNIIAVTGMTYDIENRLTSGGNRVGAYYSYDPSNKRVWRGDGNTLDEITFWSPIGQRIATYNVQSPYNNFQQVNTYSYLGAKMVLKNGGSVVEDRLESRGKFYPYGQERPSATQNDTEKFTGYYRDAATGLDYAMNRYHQPGVGRFMTADPAASSARASDPGSWNRYAYVGGDPVNHLDRTGLFSDDFDWDFLNLSSGGGWGSIDTTFGSFDIGAFIAGIMTTVCGDNGMVFSYTASGIPTCVPVQTVQNPTAQAPPTPVVTSLHITSDCWDPSNSKLSGAPSRDQTFTAFGDTSNLSGDDIAVHGEFLNHAAIGVSYKPRQCFCQR